MCVAKFAASAPPMKESSNAATNLKLSNKLAKASSLDSPVSLHKIRITEKEIMEDPIMEQPLRRLRSVLDAVPDKRQRRQSPLLLRNGAPPPTSITNEDREEESDAMKLYSGLRGGHRHH